jgi:VCBS repeat-containing protein
LSIGGGGGGAGYIGAGGKGGDAAGGIYNSGMLTIISSTISNNIAAGGGGGGGGSSTVFTNSGTGGNGGNASGGIYNIGTLRMDTTSASAMSGNIGAGGKGGKGDPGNGTDGTGSNDRTTTGTVDTSYAVPTLTGATAGQTVNDNTTLSPFAGITLTGSNLSMTITLDSAAKGTFTSASLTANGFSTADGGLTYTHAATTAAALQTAVHGLIYQATPNRVAVGSTETTTFTVAINDGSVSVSNNTTTVVATSVNDAPTGLGNTSIASIFEDAASPSGVAISALTGLSFADPDVSSSLGGIAVTGNTANSGTQGVWQYSADAGAHWYAIGTVSDTSALILSASSLLRFVPVADFNGTPTALTVRAVDNTRSGYTTSAAAEQRITAVTSTNGGITAFAAATNTISTSVTAVNDVPVFTKGGNQTVLEDAGAQTVSGWATGISAGAANESGQTLNFIVSNNNNALFSSQPSIDASGNLTFTAAANANGTATVTVSLHDNGGTTNGGLDTSATQTFTITVTAVNDAPIGVGNLTLPTVLEDTASPAGTAISALTGLAFADVDTGDTLGGLAIVANTANATTQGVWQYSTNGANWYAIGTVSDSAALTVSAATQLRFVPVADYNGTPPSLTVRAVDSSYAGAYSAAVATETRATVDVTSVHGGSTAISDNTNTVGITVTAVNDAPTFTKGADVTVLEDASAQTINNWATNLVKGPADESSQTLSFTVTNSNNALFSAQPSIDASGNLTFTGAANANGTATVTVVLHDSGGTANGGVDTSTQTFTITITPVNDAPTGLPAVSGSSTEGQVLTASTSGIADVDGLVGVPFNHQWQVSADGLTGWVDISGATASTYTLDSAQVGKYVRDKVTFTDQGGTLETLFSAASSSIAGVVPQVDSISRAGSAAVSGSATSVVYNVTFNVAVTGVGADDFLLTTTAGNAAGVISSISGSGSSYQVTVNTLTGDGDLRLDLKSSGTGIASGSATAIAGGFTAGQAYTLDHTPPSLTAVSLPNSPLKVGDTQTVTFTVADDGGSPLFLVSGTVGGYSLSGLTRVNSTTYTAQFTVTSGGADVAAGSDVPVSIVLADAAGNRNTAFTTPISQSNDSINGNAPTLLNLSNASVQTTAGVNALVGVLSTTDASVGDTFTYTIVSGTGDTDNAAFTLVGNNLRVNDPVALGNGPRSVRIRTTDSGGNSIEQAFTITVSSYSAPVAVADTASATEAGGVANANAGVNPVGNVLANDQSSNTKTITAIAGGTIGTARVGTYGSLTLNADGTYTYMVNNSNAAVQALRTNADTLTDTFTYTMADNTAATSSATLTVTIHGANDAPRVATAITTQQVTVSTPLLYVVPVGTFADVDAGDTLTYTATLNGGAPLPAWLTFNAATRTFSGTPTTVENLSIVVTATDLSAASASSVFTLQVAAAAPSGGGGTPTTPTTPTDPGTPTTPVTPPTTPVTPTDPVTPVTPVTPPVTPVTPVTPDVPVVTTPVQIPDPQVPNNPQPVQPITAVQQTPLQSISESVVETVTQPEWSANQMISESATSIRVAAPPVAPVNGFTSTAFVGTGSSFVSASGGFSPINERYSPLSPTPFNDFQRTLTDSGPGIFSVAISPLGQTGLVVLSGIQDQQFTAGDHLSFTVPSDAFGHSDAQPGIVLRASQADGRALPSWLTFNSTTGQFEGTPPPGFRGELVIKVVAKDSSGHQAEVTFRVKAHTGQTSADIPRGRSGLSEQLRTAANRTTAWVSGRI